MIGTTLGHYRVIRKIGAGGMGEVYLARDERLERDVALKFLPSSATTDPVAGARLRSDARSASALNHPHVCTILEVDEADGRAYIAMEHVEGGPLSDTIGAHGLDPIDVVRLGAQIAGALAHAHEHGVAHRDLKSANVFVTFDGHIKVLDFGLAQRLLGAELAEVTKSRRPLEQSGSIAGTLSYMAPETLRGNPADSRSDLWALGVLLYEMTSGRKPFLGKTAYELSSAIVCESAAPLPESTPPGLRAVIERSLIKVPKKRYQRASAVRAALETSLDPEPRFQGLLRRLKFPRKRTARA